MGVAVVVVGSFFLGSLTWGLHEDACGANSRCLGSGGAKILRDTCGQPATRTCSMWKIPSANLKRCARQRGYMARCGQCKACFGQGGQGATQKEQTSVSLYELLMNYARTVCNIRQARLFASFDKRDHCSLTDGFGSHGEQLLESVIEWKMFFSVQSVRVSHCPQDMHI
jgi:hypothetical protein